MVSKGFDSLFSAMVALSIGAEPYRCWRNAVLALFSCANLLEKPRYIEGWIVLPQPTTIQIAEHGWISSGPRLIDPSLVLTESREQTVCYFPGLVLTLDELPQRLQGKTLPLVCHSSYGSDGLLHPGYKQAHQQAWQCARELARQKNLPETAIVVWERAPTGTPTTIFY